MTGPEQNAVNRVEIFHPLHEKSVPNANALHLQDRQGALYPIRLACSESVRRKRWGSNRRGMGCFMARSRYAQELESI